MTTIPVNSVFDDDRWALTVFELCREPLDLPIWLHSRGLHHRTVALVRWFYAQPLEFRLACSSAYLLDGVNAAATFMEQERTRK